MSLTCESGFNGRFVWTWNSTTQRLFIKEFISHWSKSMLISFFNFFVLSLLFFTLPFLTVLNALQAWIYFLLITPCLLFHSFLSPNREILVEVIVNFKLLNNLLDYVNFLLSHNVHLDKGINCLLYVFATVGILLSAFFLYFKQYDDVVSSWD